MMGRQGFLRLLAIVALLAAPALALGLEEHTLLTGDGTLHSVRAGKAVDLGLQDATVTPDSYVVEWSSRAQDGTVSTALVPGTISYQEKRGLQLAYDDATATLLLIWTEDISAYSHVRVGVLRGGVWTNSPLLPTQGISRAHNPQMQITHQRVWHLDENDVPVSKTTSILSIVWWEEAQFLQARLATLFLDEADFDPSALALYDLPVLAGGPGGETLVEDVPSGAYLFPSLQPDGLTGAVLTSFTDLHDKTLKVIRVSFPEDQGKPSDSGDLKWQRRHIPIVGVSSTGGVPRMTPMVTTHTPRALGVGTSVGAGYRPTLYWRDGDTLKFTRLGDTEWAPVGSIAINESMTYEKALALVVSMGERN